MNPRQFIAGLATASQQRLVWYKQQLGEVHKGAEMCPAWYKEMLRDLKTFEEAWLKSLQLELTSLNQGV